MKTPLWVLALPIAIAFAPSLAHAQRRGGGGFGGGWHGGGSGGFGGGWHGGGGGFGGGWHGGGYQGGGYRGGFVAQPSVAPRFYAPQVGPRPVYVQPMRPVYNAPGYSAPMRPMFMPRPSPMWQPVRVPPPAFRVNVAPPRAYYEDRRFPAPSPSHLWIPGYWGWSGERHYWNGGHWELPPSAGVVWIGPRWTQDVGGYYSYAPGYWQNPSGGYYAASAPYPVAADPAYANGVPPANTVPAANIGEPAPAQPIALGDSTQGALERSDNAMGDGSVADDYAVELTAGQPVTVILQGGRLRDDPNRTLDAYVRLFFNDVEIAHDDNGAGGTDSLLTFTPQQSGTYAIRVTSAGAGLAEGSYTLSTYQGAVQIDRP